MAERHITLIGEHEVKISILNQQEHDYNGNDDMPSLDGCFLSKFGHTIQDLLKPTGSVKFSVIVNPKYDFYKHLSDSFTDKANNPEGLSELFARRQKCLQARKTISIDNFNNNIDDANKLNKTLRKTDESMRSFSNYRTRPKEDSQDSNEKLDRECEDHVCINHCRLSSNEEDDRQDFNMVVDQDENSLVDTFNNSVNLEPMVHSSSDKLCSFISEGSSMGKNKGSSSNNKCEIAVEILDQNTSNKDVDILARTSEEKYSQGEVKANSIEHDTSDMIKEAGARNEEYVQEYVEKELLVQNVLNIDVVSWESIKKDSLVERDGTFPNEQTVLSNKEISSNSINLQPKVSDSNETRPQFGQNSQEQCSVTVCDKSSQLLTDSSHYWNDWNCMYKRGRLDKSSFSNSVLTRSYHEDDVQMCLKTHSKDPSGTSNRTPHSSIESPQESSLKENLSGGNVVCEVLDLNSKMPKANVLNFESVGIWNTDVKGIDIIVTDKDKTYVETDVAHNDLLSVNPKVDDMNIKTKNTDKKTGVGMNVSQSEHLVHVDMESSHSQALNADDHLVNNVVLLPDVFIRPVKNVPQVPNDNSDDIEIVFENLTTVPPLLPIPTPDIILDKLGSDKIRPSHNCIIPGKAPIDVGQGPSHDCSIFGKAPIDVEPHDKAIVGKATIDGELTIESTNESRIVSRGTTNVGPTRDSGIVCRGRTNVGQTHDNISLVTIPFKSSNDATWTDYRLSQRNQDRTFTISSPESHIQLQPYEIIASPSKEFPSTSDSDTILSPGKYEDVRFSDLLEAISDVRPIITAKRKERRNKSFFPWIFIPLDVPVKSDERSAGSDRRTLETSHSSHAKPKSKRVRFNERIEADDNQNVPLPPLPPPEDLPPLPPPPPKNDALLAGGVTDCPVETAPQERRDEIFISTNMEENQDNFNPEWSEVAKIYNTQRYDLIQRRWDTNTVANPKRNLTLLQYNVRTRNKRRTEPISLYNRTGGDIGEDEPLAKRARMESCTYIFDKLIEEVKKRIERVTLMFTARKREALAELKRRQHRQSENRANKYLIMQQHREELRRFNEDSGIRLQNILNPFTSRVQKLNSLREEMIHFYNFYRGLSRDNELALHLTPEEAEDILSVEATISGYRDSYGDNK
ncbi:hypothetical protein WDU94_001173 [Cyamophila willieti]